MKLAVLSALAFALLAAGRERPPCECCGPGGASGGTSNKRTKCYEEADNHSPVVITYPKGTGKGLWCRTGDYFVTRDNCFVRSAHFTVSEGETVRPCEADEGCLAEEGPMIAYTVRSGPSNCYADSTSSSEVLRVYEPDSTIYLWCKGGELFYLTTDKCWVGASNVPAKSSAVPICGNWRPE